MLKSKDLFYDNCLSFMAWGIITANTFRFNHMFLFQEQKTKIITKNGTVVKIKIWTHMAKYAHSNLCAGISLSSAISLKWRQFILIIRVETLWARGKMCGKQEKINSKRRCYIFRQEFADKCSLDHRLWCDVRSFDQFVKKNCQDFNNSTKLTVDESTTICVILITLPIVLVFRVKSFVHYQLLQPVNFFSIIWSILNSIST